MRNFNPKALCNKCQIKKASGLHSCPFEQKHMCPNYQAYVADNALQFEDSALQIPIESLLTALRFHGYFGELRKSEIVVI